MAQVVVREGENLESALKRFKRSCARDGVMSEPEKLVCQLLREMRDDLAGVREGMATKAAGRNATRAIRVAGRRPRRRSRT